MMKQLERRVVIIIVIIVLAALVTTICVVTLADQRITREIGRLGSYTIKMRDCNNACEAAYSECLVNLPKKLDDLCLELSKKPTTVVECDYGDQPLITKINEIIYAETGVKYAIYMRDHGKSQTMEIEVM